MDMGLTVITLSSILCFSLMLTNALYCKQEKRWKSAILWSAAAIITLFTILLNVNIAITTARAEERLKERVKITEERVKINEEMAKILEKVYIDR